MEPTPSAIDGYITKLFRARYDLPLYDKIFAIAQKHGLPEINISASEGMLLHVLAKATGARRILEIGTLGGYSGTWLASALPGDGKLVALELNEKHAAAAREAFELAGLSPRTEVKVGDATATLDGMLAAGEPQFDIVFIDADKGGYVGYFERALKLTRPGGLILADNTLSHGVLDGDPNSPIANYNATNAASQAVTSALVTTMRDGVDGLTISVVE